MSAVTSVYICPVLCTWSETSGCSGWLLKGKVWMGCVLLNVSAHLYPAPDQHAHTCTCSYGLLYWQTTPCTLNYWPLKLAFSLKQHLSIPVCLSKTLSVKQIQMPVLVVGFSRNQGTVSLKCLKLLWWQLWPEGLAFKRRIHKWPAYILRERERERHCNTGYRFFK